MSFDSAQVECRIGNGEPWLFSDVKPRVVSYTPFPFFSFYALGLHRGSPCDFLADAAESDDVYFANRGSLAKKSDGPPVDLRLPAQIATAPLSSACRQCGIPLPISDAGRGRPGRVWLCRNCRYQYVGELVEGYQLNQLRAIAPPRFAFPRAMLFSDSGTPSSRQPESFSMRPPHIENRATARQQLVVAAPLQELDRQLRPVGQPYLVTTLDFSALGMAFLHSRHIDHPMAVIELLSGEEAPVQFILQIVRCKRQDQGFEIAATLLTKTATEPVG